MSRTAVAVTTAIVGAAVVAAVLLLSGPGEAGSSAREDLAACAERSGEQQESCFERVFAQEAAEGKVAETLSVLEGLVDDGVLDDCHLRAHAVAHAAVAVVGVDRAFDLATGHCRMGYVHGVAESGAGRPDARPAAVASLAGARCSRLDKGKLAASCSHGFGHALMRNRGSIIDAVRSCRQAERFGIDVRPCEAGVMMQHSLSYARLPPGDFVVAAAKACAPLGERRLRTRCHRNVGVVSAFVVLHDERRAEALCRRLHGTARLDCLGGAAKEIAEARGER
jgi:hypothetical protein